MLAQYWMSSRFRIASVIKIAPIVIKLLRPGLYPSDLSYKHTHVQTHYHSLSQTPSHPCLIDCWSALHSRISSAHSWIFKYLHLELRKKLTFSSAVVPFQGLGHVPKYLDLYKMSECIYYCRGVRAMFMPDYGNPSCSFKLAILKYAMHCYLLQLSLWVKCKYMRWWIC